MGGFQSRTHSRGGDRGAEKSDQREDNEYTKGGSDWIPRKEYGLIAQGGGKKLVMSAKGGGREGRETISMSPRKKEVLIELLQDGGGGKLIPRRPKRGERENRGRAQKFKSRSSLLIGNRRKKYDAGGAVVIERDKGRRGLESAT